MNDLQRFLAVCHGDRPDYIPIFGFPWAGGMTYGCMRTTYNNLLKTGMPDIGGVWDLDGQGTNPEGWQEYWGTDTIMELDFYPANGGGSGISSTKTVKDGFEYIEYESGALTKQVINNDITYSMPEYIRHHIRDRESFEFYKSRNSPSKPWTKEQIDKACEPYKNRTRPLWVTLGSSWGTMREFMGPVDACTVLYDAPELAADILEWIRSMNREFLFPVIEHIKPEVVAISEDFCYNHGMFISPDHFNEFCAQTYQEIGEVVKSVGVPVFAVDCDGFVEPALPLLTKYGVNAMFPWEVKAGNDLYRVRENYPELIIFGGLEKESINIGNQAMIRPEIESKLDLIRGGRYFPNGDHGIQPLADYESLCKFMTLLHEVTENPKGVFPRIQP